MPRQGRIQSGTGVYHVMMRGINRQQIFESEEDNRHMLYILSNLHLQYSPEGTPLSSPTCTIYAYCLMGNHFHLPIQERAWTIGEIIKSLASSYVYYFNKKYQRIGHLFQDRFKSEPVNDMNYFVNTGDWLSFTVATARERSLSPVHVTLRSRHVAKLHYKNSKYRCHYEVPFISSLVMPLIEVP